MKPKPVPPVRAASPADDAAYLLDVITRIVDTFPRRQATSDDELGAQELVRREFEALGFGESEFHSFRFNDNLYATLALHFGLGTAGTAVSGVAPLAGAALHLLAGLSYYLDSTQKRFILRRLQTFKESQNLLVTLPAVDEPALRIVYPAHIDAALTGWMFNPAVIRRTNPLKTPDWLGPLKKPLRLATYTQLALVGFDLLRAALGPVTLPLRPLEWALTVPGAVAFVTNLDVVLRDQVVPGANDDLSGVAALLLLAKRLAPDKPDNVELVFAVTGCEESGMGGATALARDASQGWDRRRTVVLGVDTLAGGDLCWFREGEIKERPVAPWLRDTLDSIAAEPQWRHTSEFRIPVGATDVLSFLIEGYDGVCIGRVDRELGAPRNYHLPSDTPANLDADQVVESVEYIERITRAIYARRLR